MDLNDILAKVGWSAHAAVLAPDWDASQAGRPAGVSAFLQPDTVAWACGQAFLPPDITKTALAAAGRMADDPALGALARYFHHCLFRLQVPDARIRKWPPPPEVMGDLAGYFYVVVLLSGTDFRLSVHRRRGIPPPIAKDSIYDLDLSIRTERQADLKGRPGVGAYILSWLMYNWSGRLYRLGRLQFMPGRFTGKLRAFRHRRTGAVVALAEDGCRFRADGLFDGAGEVTDPAGAWTAHLVADAAAVRGFPILAAGRAVNREVTLRTRDWAACLSPGDPILEVHIPAELPMAFEACGASLRQALEFFPRHYPEVTFAGFVCGSWILDPQFDRLLAPTSNLVRFQKEFHLYPLPGGSGALPWQVEVRRDPAAGAAPALTSMQRAFSAHVARRGRFFGGGCFMLASDLNWGRQVYRTQKLPWAP